MRVVFSREVLDDEPSWKWLDRILESVENEWHLWEVEDAEDVEQSKWFLLAGRTQPFLRTLLELSARRGAWRGESGLHSRVVVVHVASAMPCALDAPSAAELLRQPLLVLVENITSDGAFLDAVLDVLGGEELRELRRTRPPAIEYDSPGGNGELNKRLDYHLGDAIQTRMPRRLLVVTDSDAPRPGEWGRKARAVAEHCRKRKIVCHVLEKRSIENYIPQEAVDDWALEPGRVNARPLVAALGRLSPQQRDHFPIKKGLPADMDRDEGALYQQVSAEDRRLLSRESMSKRSNDWASLYRAHRRRITPDTLRNRAGLRDGGTTELDALVEAICSLL